MLLSSFNIFALVLAASSVIGAKFNVNRIQPRQQSGTATVPYQAYVDAARESIHAGHVAKRNARLLREAIANNDARSSAVASSLRETQASNLRAIMQLLPLLNLTQEQTTTFTTTFVAQQEREAATSASQQMTISNNNQNAVASAGQAAQTRANQQVVSFSRTLNTAIVNRAGMRCGSEVCRNVINGGNAFCSSSNTCSYVCGSGASPVTSNPAFVNCVETNSDVNNCGTAGFRCPGPYNGLGNAVCANGNCAIRCPAGASSRFLPNGAQFCRQ